jgi:hypothetical protein
LFISKTASSTNCAMSSDIVFAVAATAPSSLSSVGAAWQGEGEFIDVELGRS